MERATVIKEKGINFVMDACNCKRDVAYYNLNTVY